MSIARIQIQNLKQVQDEFRDIGANQIPFATAKALTRTAQDGQKVIQNNVLGARFTIRRASWAKSGIRITAATKQLLQAIVEDINKYMALQETGGEKLPYKQYIAVPLSGARPSLSAIVSDDNKPAAVMARGGFIRGNVMYAVSYARGQRRLSRTKGGYRSAQLQVVPMYALVHQARIKPRYGFQPAVVEVVEKNFDANFKDAFQAAVRTAKR